MNATSNAYTLCGAKTRSGEPCKRPPMIGKRRCRNHGGCSTGPKTDAGRKRIGLAQLKHGRYVGIREKRAINRYYKQKVLSVLSSAKDAGLI